MPLFSEREQAFEAEFAHEQEIAFAIAARRNRLVGLWAARKMGLAGQVAEQYARDVVGDEVGRGDDAVAARLLSDLHARGINIGEPAIRAQLVKRGRQARQEITGKSP